MQFQPFEPEFNAQRREANGRIIESFMRGTSKPVISDRNLATIDQIKAEERFVRARRPFYRVYPGVMSALLRLDIEKIDISRIRPPLPELSLEFAKEYPLRTLDREVASIMVADCDDQLFIEHCVVGKLQGVMYFPKEHFSIVNYLDTMDESFRNTSEAILKIVFGVCMIPQDDGILMTPKVLACDQDKYQQTGDEKYVEKARRRGVIGWDVGRDIPLPEEIERVRREGEAGRKSPHLRIGHAAIYHTGKDRQIPVIRWVDTIFVNKDIAEKVPHGYHGADSE